MPSFDLFGTVVGVVGNVRNVSLESEGGPAFYFSYGRIGMPSLAVVVRTVAPPETMAAALRAPIASLDRDLPVYNVRTLDQLVYNAAGQPRFQTVLLGLFGVVALLLAAVGVYGVMAYVVTQRASEIDFTEPYIEIEATYLVPSGSPIRTIGEVDRKGVRIAVASRSAYDLWLVRNIKHAALVRAEGIEGSYQLFVKEKLDVLAGLKPRLLQDLEKLPGSRILDGQITGVQQAVGTPKLRAAAAQFLGSFVEDLKQSGLVSQIIAKHGVRGVVVK